jgi:NAD(P)-dependent dehydrogenase (short-subunit alcohol dehydrogenase family)
MPNADGLRIMNANYRDTFPMKTPPDYVPGHGLLRGKSVLVTAAAGAGIGFAVAKRAAEEGCRALFISDVHERRLNEAVQTLQKETGLQAIFSQLCDVSQESQVQSLIDEAVLKMGSIDVLVNNAGLGGSKKIVDMADEEWDKVIGVTLTGTFRVTRAALKVMQTQGQGVIVNNALCRSQSWRHGFNALRRIGSSRIWCPHQCCCALYCHSRVSQKISIRRTAQSIVRTRGLWSRCRTLGSSQRHGIFGQRLFFLHDG